MEPLIDSHCHLTDKAFEKDLGDVLGRAAQEGIESVVTISEDLDDAVRTLGLANEHEMVHATVGIHPHRASTWNDESPEALRSLVEKNSPVAIGEIGLDYHYDFSPREIQRRAFREQLQLAKELTLPVVIHSRESDEDLFAILSAEKPYPNSGVVHCFNGSAEAAKRALDLGFYIGIGGMSTFRKANDLRKIIAEYIPLDRLLVETDAPYLAPEPRRGRRNEPAYVRYIAEKVADVCAVDMTTLAAATHRNTVSLFRLDRAFT